MKFMLLILTVLLLSTLATACEAGSTPTSLQDEDPGKTIGDDADPAIVAELPISTRSFEMGTAGFVPKNYPNSSNDDWQDFF